MGGGGGDDAAPASTPATTSESTPAETTESAPAVAAAASVPATPDPVAPWVEAAQTRQKIPVWAVPVLALLPLWGVVYALTLDEPTPTEPGAYELGAEVYSGQGCSGCHGAGGGGQGAVPALSGDGNPAVVFERPGDMVTWIALGTGGYEAAGIATYGNGKPVGGSGAVMPAHLDSLSAEQLMAVVLHERTAFGNDEAFDIEVWENGFEEAVTELMPDQAAEYLAVLEEWAADPPTP
jgi:mono/diheme cytochrome c family protein